MQEVQVQNINKCKELPHLTLVVFYSEKNNLIDVTYKRDVTYTNFSYLTTKNNIISLYMLHKMPIDC